MYDDSKTGKMKARFVAVIQYQYSVLFQKKKLSMSKLHMCCLWNEERQI